MKHRIVLSDLHLPFHDQKLLDCWLKRLRDIEWGGIDIIGDLIDCYTLSRFDRNPSRRDDLQLEIDRAHNLLVHIRRDCPNADIRYSEGNHEDRLRKMLWSKAPALAPLRNLTIPDLLGLKDLGIKWHAAGEPYKIGDLWYSHGHLLRKQASQSARAASDEINGSIMVGHCHREGWSPFTTLTGTHHAYECGHMSDPSQLDYVSGVFNWQAGWAEVTFLEGTHQVDFYRVVDRGRERMVIGPEGVMGKWRTRR